MFTSSVQTPTVEGPTVSAPNQQGTQLLAKPNLQEIPQMGQQLKMGMASPGGLRTPATGQPSFPVGGMNMGGMSALSPNPMTVNPQQQAMIAALMGQQANG